jgi:hypothetical protein
MIASSPRKQCEIIKDSFSFDNDAKGFGQLLDILQALDPSQSKRIGLEATGHYGYNLKVFLDRHGLTIWSSIHLSEKNFHRTFTEKDQNR